MPEAITKDLFYQSVKQLYQGKSCTVMFLRMLIFQQYFQMDSLEQRV